MHDVHKLKSKSLRRTMATILSANVSMAEVVAIGEWSSEAMARKYIATLQVLTSGTKRYADYNVAAASSPQEIVDAVLEQGATDGESVVPRCMAPIRRHACGERAPHRTKQYTAAQLAVKAAYAEHGRAAG